MKTTRSAQAAARRVVGDHHQRAPASIDGLAQQREHLAAGAQVERAGRLVGEHELGLADQRPRDRHALLLAAGELGRAMARAVGEPDGRERLAHRAARQPPAGEPRRQRDVLRRGQRRQQVEGLEDEPDALAPQAGQRPLASRAELEVTEDDSSRGRPVEPGGGLQERRLAGARRPHHGGEGAALEGERDAVERADGAVAGAEVADQGSRGGGRSLCRSTFPAAGRVSLGRRRVPRFGNCCQRPTAIPPTPQCADPLALWHAPHRPRRRRLRRLPGDGADAAAGAGL